MDEQTDQELQAKLADAHKAVGQLNRMVAEYPAEKNLAALRAGVIQRRRKILAGIAKNDAGRFGGR